MGAVDWVGRKRLLLIGAVAFGIASACAAYASSPGQLVFWRAVLGVAGATLMPSTMGLIRTIFTDEKSMMTAIGIWFSCFTGGMAVGPLVGGLPFPAPWWGSAFLLGVPFMPCSSSSATGSYRSRSGSPPRASTSPAILFLAMILPIIHGFKEIARGGNAATASVAVTAGLAMAVLFIRRQRRIENPLVDLALFRSRAFSTALAVMLIGGVVMAGVSFLSTQWLQLVAGLDPLGAGLWMLPANVALLLGLSSSATIARRLGTGRTMAAGLGICASGLVAYTQVGPAWESAFVLGMSLASFGIMLPSTPDDVRDDAVPRRSSAPARWRRCPRPPASSGSPWESRGWVRSPPSSTAMSCSRMPLSTLPAPRPLRSTPLPARSRQRHPSCCRWPWWRGRAGRVHDEPQRRGWARRRPVRRGRSRRPARPARRPAQLPVE